MTKLYVPKARPYKVCQKRPPIINFMEQFRKSPRAQWIDYDNGTYFITICCGDMCHYFGQIIDDEMRLSEIGNFVTQQLASANSRNCNLRVELFTVMPNHLHAIISVWQENNEAINRQNIVDMRVPIPSLRADTCTKRHTPVLSSFINQLKGATTKFAKQNGLKFLWQSRYHDHLIRSQFEANKIAEYISTNPQRWLSDCFHR